MKRIMQQPDNEKSIITSIFDDILECHQNDELNIKEKYEALNRDFMIALKDRTKNSNIVFAGPFPRMAYLCKRYQLHESLYAHINAFRIHCRENYSIDTTALESSYKYDLKALTDFLSSIYQTDPPEALTNLLHFPYQATNYPSEYYQSIKIVVESWDK